MSTHWRFRVTGTRPAALTPAKPEPRANLQDVRPRDPESKQPILTLGGPVQAATTNRTALRLAALIPYAAPSPAVRAPLASSAWCADGVKVTAAPIPDALCPFAAWADNPAGREVSLQAGDAGALVFLYHGIQRSTDDAQHDQNADEDQNVHVCHLLRASGRWAHDVHRSLKAMLPTRVSWVHGTIVPACPAQPGPLGARPAVAVTF
jgi:hypothetical protein